MRDRAPTAARTGAGLGRAGDGFTLIEVIGALVIFAVGVLMAASLAGSLSVQVRDAAVRAAVVSATQEKLDEVERQDYESMSPGSEVETMTILGRDYERTTVITDYGTRIRSVEVALEPASGSSGPSHTLLTYAYDPW